MPADGLWAEIRSFANLHRAAHAAARGKRNTRAVARFLDGLEPELLRLQRELDEETYRPGELAQFTIHDPKERVISVAPFRDRVVHHAVIDPLEPAFEALMIHDSYACRRGKGQGRALRRAQHLLRRHEWFLKLDVSRFFPSVRHDVVLRSLEPITGSTRVLRLCRIILAGSGREGRGLPIGSLTSQWFANLVLDQLDHHVLTRIAPAGYLRYMDDFVLFAADKDTLRGAHAEVARYLADELDLVLKDRGTILAPAHVGLPYLGWRIYRRMMRLRLENLRRTRKRLKQRTRQHERGQIDEHKLADCHRAVAEHLRLGSTLGLRRRMFLEGPPGRGPPPVTSQPR